LKVGEYKARMFRSVLRLLARHAKDVTTLVDVGCSYGSFLQHARISGYHGSGMEIVPEAVAYVRRLGFYCQETAFVADLKVPDGSVDIISVLGALRLDP